MAIKKLAAKKAIKKKLVLKKMMLAAKKVVVKKLVVKMATGRKKLKLNLIATRQNLNLNRFLKNYILLFQQDFFVPYSHKSNKVNIVLYCVVSIIPQGFIYHFHFANITASPTILLSNKNIIFIFPIF